ncbi:MAG: hypothetical protein WBC18_07845 [Ottowia sp.]|uniref:hypothetical protein n=1 Tax=Ottowia sp. TaxID=1898956 RepID=UPI003C75BA09
MIPFKFSPVVRFTVEGTYNDEDGLANPFSFWLKCERLETDVINDWFKRPGALVADFVVTVAKDWGDVKTADGQAVPFSDENLRAFLAQAGMGQVCFQRYMQEAGAKPKN